MNTYLHARAWSRCLLGAMAGAMGLWSWGALGGGDERPAVRREVEAAAQPGVGPRGKSGVEPGVLLRVDFSDQGQAGRWRVGGDAAPGEVTAEGMRVRVTGDDPQFEGEVEGVPADRPWTAWLRLRTQGGGMVQVFPIDRGASEERSEKEAVAGGGEWRELRFDFQPSGEVRRLRIDLPGGAGDCVLSSLRVEPGRVWEAPGSWPRPTAFEGVGPGVLSLESGEVELLHAGERWGDFAVRVRGVRVACGLNRPMVGLVSGGKLRWVDVGPRARVRGVREERGLSVAAEFKDDDGVEWRWTQRFTPAAGGGLEVVSEVQAAAGREVVFLPWLMLTPGLGDHGAHKGQALFAGLEYLENEPSRSEADVRGASAMRLAPASWKVTMPLMALQAGDRWVGLVWEPSEHGAAVFDSPDRTFGSGSHVMGLIAPGAGAAWRRDGSLMPRTVLRLEAGRAMRQRAVIVGGMGGDLTPAIRRCVELRGLPEMPARFELDEYMRLAGAGWMETPLGSGGRFAHALDGERFGKQPAADAAWMIGWLAGREQDAGRARRLGELAASARAAASDELLYASGIGHVQQRAVAPMVFNRVPAAMALARRQGWERVRSFRPDGGLGYRQPDRAGTDYASTHYDDEANGYTALSVALTLEDAAFSGDGRLLAEGLRLLRKLDRFRGGVPRGAQTWEIPLHAPDILASAHLVRAYTLGFELTGDPGMLEAARDWAWTGVPFVYLYNPTGQAVGPYATIAVLGATEWTGPSWIGLPVQWCGLVYADAVLRLERHDPTGPWDTLARGIVLSGIQQTYPLDHPHRGLLPDSYVLLAQHRQLADINPATLQAVAMRTLGGLPTYDHLRLGGTPVRVLAPGLLETVAARPREVGFRVKAWPQGEYTAVVHGVPQGAATVEVDGKPAPADAITRDLGSGAWLLKLRGSPSVTLRW